MNNPVKIEHPKLRRTATVPAASVKHWEKRGWKRATATKSDETKSDETKKGTA